MKPYHLCHERLGCTAPLVTHQQTTITLVSAAVPRTRRGQAQGLYLIAINGSSTWTGPGGLVSVLRI